jgi:hypothetical protein
MRKPFATTIEEDVQSEFKKMCKKNCIKMNDVLEAMMRGFNENIINVRASFSIDVKEEKK